MGISEGLAAPVRGGAGVPSSWLGLQLTADGPSGRCEPAFRLPAAPLGAGLCFLQAPVHPALGPGPHGGREPLCWRQLGKPLGLGLEGSALRTGTHGVLVASYVPRVSSLSSHRMAGGETEAQ